MSSFLTSSVGLGSSSKSISISSSSGAVVTAPLSISAKFTFLLFLFLPFCLTVQTSLATSSPSSSLLSSSSSSIARTNANVNVNQHQQQPRHKKASASVQPPFSNEDKANIAALLSQWAKNNGVQSPKQKSKPIQRPGPISEDLTASGSESSPSVTSAISSLLQDFKTLGSSSIELLGDGLGVGGSETAVASNDDAYQYAEYGSPYGDENEIQPETSHASEVYVDHPHDHGHSVLKPEYKETESWWSSAWSWLASDGVSTIVPLILFGVIPIIIGLIPFLVIATNFWWIFHKIHGLHTLFWGLLGSHDETSYDSYYGWPSSYSSSLPSSGWGWGEYSLNH